MDALLEFCGLVLIVGAMAACVAAVWWRRDLVHAPLILLLVGAAMYYLVPLLAGALLALPPPERWGEAIFLHGTYLSLWLLAFFLAAPRAGPWRPGLAACQRLAALLPTGPGALAAGGALCLALCLARVALYPFSSYSTDEFVVASAYTTFDKYLVERLVYVGAPLAALTLAALWARRHWLLGAAFAAAFAVYLKLLLGGGARLLVAEPLLFVFFGLLYFQRRTAAWVTLVSCLLLVVAIGPIVQMSRHRIVQDGMTDARRAATDWWWQHSPRQLLQTSLETIVMRSDALDNTVVLLDRLNAPERFAGPRPYRGFLVRWIPRFLYPERPFAGSIDHTISGCLPQVLCTYVLGTDANGLTAFGGMMMYWQFGWPGVVGGALVCGALCRWWLEFVFGYGVLGFALFLAASNHLTFVNTPCSLDQLLEATLSPTAYLLLVVLACNVLAYFLRPADRPKPA